MKMLTITHLVTSEYFGNWSVIGVLAGEGLRALEWPRPRVPPYKCGKNSSVEKEQWRDAD